MSDPGVRVWLLAIALVLGLVAAAGAESMNAEVWDNVQKTDCRAWAKRFDPFRLEWRVEGDTSAGGATIRCVTRVDDGGRGRKGAKVTLTATARDGAGDAIALGTRSARTDQGGIATIEFPVTGAGGSFTATVEGRYSTWKKATTISTDCGPAGP